MRAEAKVVQEARKLRKRLSARQQRQLRRRGAEQQQQQTQVVDPTTPLPTPATSHQKRQRRRRQVEAVHEGPGPTPTLKQQEEAGVFDANAYFWMYFSTNEKDTVVPPSQHASKGECHAIITEAEECQDADAVENSNSIYQYTGQNTRAEEGDLRVQGVFTAE